MNQHADYPLVSEEEADGIAWAFQGPNQEAVKYPFKFPPIGDNEIRIKQSYFGICYTDCHLANQDWFDVNYPLVPGHEVLGRVTLLGRHVQNFKVGDLVGFGFIRDSCGGCGTKSSNYKNTIRALPPGVGVNKVMPNPKFGGFATHVQAPAKWAFPIPNNLPEELVPPLMCAGATVYAPLKRHTQPGQKVGIVGIGGLGHLAIKIGAAMGLKPTVFSSTEGKREEALSYGAAEFIVSTDVEQLKQNKGKFDVILMCAHAQNTEQFQQYFSLLRNGGEFIQVGIFHKDTTIELPYFDVLACQRSYIGSLVASREETFDMLEFCSNHNIVPTVEHFGFEDFNKAYQHLLNGTPKYRCVVKI